MQIKEDFVERGEVSRSEAAAQTLRANSEK